MEVTLEYWDTISHTDWNSEKKREETLTGTEEEVYKQFHDKNNRLRYCNGAYYKFKDKAIEVKYNTWYDNLSESTRFEMYYGNGVVD